MFGLILVCILFVVLIIAIIGTMFEKPQHYGVIPKDPTLSELEKMNQFTINEQMGYVKKKD